MDLVDAFPCRSDCDYTSCYCEENIWKLCERLSKAKSVHLRNCYAVFVSSDVKLTPLWCQINGKGEDGFVLWDYHAFLVHKGELESYIYDFDTSLDFPTSFNEYVVRAIRWAKGLPSLDKRKFRIIEAPVFLESFASDRSHMKRCDGTYLSKPPNYPPISIPGTTNNLQDFISMNPLVGVGEVLDLNAFISFFGTKSN